MSGAFPIYINDRARIINDPLQWIIQHLRGNRWVDWSFFTDRDIMATRVIYRYDALRDTALQAIASLPSKHPH